MNIKAIIKLLEIVELPKAGVSLAEAHVAIEKMRNQVFTNKATKITARLSASAKGKLVSNKATGKSKANGFTREQHNAMAAHVGDLFERSLLFSSRADKDGDANILSIKRFVCRVLFGACEACAWITVKESKQHGHHIYSVESIKLEALDRIVEVVSGNTPHASSAPLRNIIAYFLRACKGVFAKIFRSYLRIGYAEDKNTF